MNIRENPPYRSVVSINLHSNFIETRLQRGCFSVNLLRICRTSFHGDVSGGHLPLIYSERLNSKVVCWKTLCLVATGKILKIDTSIYMYWYESHTLLSLREKCPNTELFLARIFLYLDWIRTVFGLKTESPSSVRIQEQRTRNNSVFEHFSSSVFKDLEP